MAGRTIEGTASQRLPHHGLAGGMVSAVSATNQNLTRLLFAVPCVVVLCGQSPWPPTNLGAATIFKSCVELQNDPDPNKRCRVMAPSSTLDDVMRRLDILDCEMRHIRNGTYYATLDSETCAKVSVK